MFVGTLKSEFEKPEDTYSSYIYTYIYIYIYIRPDDCHLASSMMTMEF